MTTMTIKNIPDELYEKLKKRAEEQGRSMNSEVIACLKRALQGGRIDPEAFLARVEAMQRQVSIPPLTDEILRRAKEEGRP
ncbi:MAG: Arc family DNA-binding protein [Thermodesulfobacteriota bacterium]